MPTLNEADFDSYPKNPSVWTHCLGKKHQTNSEQMAYRWPSAGQFHGFQFSPHAFSEPIATLQTVRYCDTDKETKKHKKPLYSTDRSARCMMSRPPKEAPCITALS